jgi:hypothetical protein
MFDVGGPVAWSPRRRGQFLVVVGVLLGTLSGVVLGLAVDDPQTSMAVADPGRAAGAALAAHPPSSQPTTSRTAGAGKAANGDASTGKQPTKLTDRPDNGHGKAGKDGDVRQDKPAKDKPGKDEPGKGKPGKGKNN